MVADIFATRIARRLIIPRGLNARRKRGGDEMAAMLAFANGALEGGKVPTARDLVAETKTQLLMLRHLGEVQALVRIGEKVIELIRIGRAEDEFVPCAPGHHDRRDRPLRQIFPERLSASRR
jgi:hypothetical protein